MDYKHLSRKSYLDILFLNRNKAYGSYQLRIAYNSNAYKAIGTFALLLIFSIGITKWHPKGNQADNMHQEADQWKEVLINHVEKIELIPEKIKPAQTIPPAVSAGIKTVKQSANTAIVSNQSAIDPRDMIKDIPADAHAGNEDFDTDNMHGKAGGKGNEDDGFAKQDNDNKDVINTWKDDQSIYQQVDIKATPNYDVIAFIKKNLHYPELAKANEIEGTVHITFIVEKDGSISNVTLATKDIGGGCSQAAIDVVKKFPKWKPATKNNIVVRSFMKVPISFKLLR